MAAHSERLSTTPILPTRVDSQERALGFKSAHPGARPLGIGLEELADVGNEELWCVFLAEVPDSVEFDDRSVGPDAAEVGDGSERVDALVGHAREKNRRFGCECWNAVGAGDDVLGDPAQVGEQPETSPSE